ncbi:ATP-binding protein [Candidatus Woesearchaeota archaeon]|nr:MAG: ATP-binding protein [Candidatus Woesearchaeota archaeon]
MSLGTITGTTTTTHFSFIVEGTAQKFEYVCFNHEGKQVLAQILDLKRDEQKTLAYCAILGYHDGSTKSLRTPPAPGEHVEIAPDELISKVIELKSEHGGFLGFLDGKNIPVHINLEEVLTKHLAVLAKSGAGKSYTVGVLLEEILKKKVPLVILDPHGEYSVMKYPNEDDREKLKEINLEPLSFIKQIQEFNAQNPLRLPVTLDSQELVNILPAKLNNQQLTLLYSCMQNCDHLDFDELIGELTLQESASKYALIDLLNYVRRMNIFSHAPTPLNEIVKPGRASIVNLKGRAPEESEILVAKLCKELFEARKRNLIPPFFLVLEEAHNFCPERSFGETKASKILRTIAAEGRKFGLGLALISQRPARVDKSVLSQCSTQIILKLTNPSDVKAVANSVEGMTKETEDILPTLPIGTALVTGVVDLPLLVNVRTRQTKHGGEAASIFDQQIIEETADPVILPTTTLKDLELMKNDDEEVITYKIPAVLLQCQGKAPFQLLIELNQGKIVRDINNAAFSEIPELNTLSPNQLAVVQKMSDKQWYHAADFADLGLDFALAHDMLQKLTKKGFFEVNKDKFKVKEDIPLDLEEVAFFGKLSFKEIKGEQIPQIISIEEVKKKISFMVPVIGEQPCSIIWHKVQKVKKCAESSDQEEESLLEMQ